MVGASKKLTVSYGIFSCTLEGFDDPFTAIGVIAEHLRDLSAGDPSFGDSPNPDAETLKRIAEKNIQRPVEARVDEDGITLRQVDADMSVASAALAGAAALATGVVEEDISETVEATNEVVEEDVVEEEVASVVERDEVAVENETEQEDSVAAKLARVRADVSENSDAIDNGYAEDQHAEEVFVGEPIETAFDDLDDQSEAEIEVEAEVEGEKVEETPIDLSVRADAQVEIEASDGVDEDVVAEDAAQDFGDAAVNISKFFAATDADDADSDDMTTGEGLDAAVETDASDEAEPLAAGLGEKDEDADELEENDEIFFDEDVAEADDEIEAVETVAVDASGQSGNAGDDFDLDGDFEEEQQDVSIEEEAKSPVDEDEDDDADLIATLAMVQKEHAAEGRAEKEGRAMLANKDIEEDEDAVDRILDVTNIELEETEGTRRRDVIAHLKAAVQATRADRNIQEEREQEEADELDQYREDLDRVVHPNRAAGSKDSSGHRMAPLVLVTEQRVEEDELQEAPVVADVTDDLAEAEDGAIDASNRDLKSAEDYGSFNDFVEHMGAKSLPELLEAAAAYSSYVKGEPHFSRPQIMRAVMAYDSSKEFSREDSLRSFGELLRRGKIQKLDRGRFTISESSRFNPEVRAAGE